MILFPAIDIKDEHCVRLVQGDFSQVKVYDANPVEVAKKWERAGATHLHIVDLDGARLGKRVNAAIIEQIVAETNLSIELGGGIRSLEDIEFWIDKGISNVILGTVAVENFELVKEAVEKYGEKIIVGVDAKGGYVAINGWKTITPQCAYDFCKRLEEIGVKTVVYTDIAKDGMMVGPNFRVYEDLQQITNLQIVASGGVAILEDLVRLQEIGVYGAITGKALYEGSFTLEEGLSCLQDESSPV